MLNINKYKNRIIAHRGVHNNTNIPENSLLSFKKALENNYPIELDIHLTKDHELVVFHDHNTKRMTNVSKNIEEETLTTLKSLTLLQTNEKIPTIDEVLNLINSKVLIDIEIKANSTKNMDILLDKLLAKLKTYKGEIIIKSFNPILVKRLKKKTSNYPIGLLISYNTSNKKFNIIFRTNLLLAYSKPDFIAIDKLLLNKPYFQRQIKKYPTLIWTINSKSEIEKINNNNLIYICNNLLKDS